VVSIGPSCSGKLVEQSSELARPSEERRVGTRNLDAVDTKALPGARSAELDADGRVRTASGSHRLAQLWPARWPFVDRFGRQTKVVVQPMER
jgi:hypothetical protein